MNVNSIIFSLHKLPIRPIKQILRITPILFFPIPSFVYTEFRPCFIQRFFILHMIKWNIKLCFVFTAANGVQARFFARKHRIYFIYPLHRFGATSAMFVNCLKILFPRILFPVFIINLQIGLMFLVEFLQFTETIKSFMFLKQRSPSIATSWLFQSRHSSLSDKYNKARKQVNLLRAFYALS